MSGGFKPLDDRIIVFGYCLGTYCNSREVGDVFEYEGVEFFDKASYYAVSLDFRHGVVYYLDEEGVEIRRQDILELLKKVDRDRGKESDLEVSLTAPKHQEMPSDAYDPLSDI